MDARERAFGAFLADLLTDAGFRPGLRPRSHAGSGLAGDEDPEAWVVDAGERICEIVGADAADEDMEELSRELEGPEDAAGEGEAEPEAPEPLLHAAGRPSGRRACRRELRRIAAARRELGAIGTSNRYQRELVDLLGAILGYMAVTLCPRGRRRELERWWGYFDALRRAVDFPQLEGRKARVAFDVLMELEPEDLFEAARRGHMGHRMPKKQPAKRRTRRCVRR